MLVEYTDIKEEQLVSLKDAMRKVAVCVNFVCGGSESKG